jgi:hypothetical protein
MDVKEMTDKPECQILVLVLNSSPQQLEQRLLKLRKGLKLLQKVNLQFLDGRFPLRCFGATCISNRDRKLRAGQREWETVWL